MADANSSEQPLTFRGQLHREARTPPPHAPLVRRLEGVVGLVPTFRDTKKGRSNARQLRLALLGLGLLVLVFGGGIWIFVGLAFMSAALVVPAPEVRRRTWIARLRNLRRSRRQWLSAPVIVELDSRRISIIEDGKRLRRVLVDRGDHRLRTASLHIDGRSFTALGVSSSSGRKAEAIWLYTDSAAPLPHTPETVERDFIDLLVRLDPSDFDRLREQL